MFYESDLLLKLVSIDTTATERKNYFEIAGLMVEEAKKAGLLAEQVVGKDGIPHIIMTLSNAPKDAKKIIFLTHYDVVPAGKAWDFDPFKPFIKEGKLFGRGASDNKSNIVAAMGAFKDALEEGLLLKVNPVLIIAGGEETGESEEFFRKLQGDICVVLDVGCEALSIGASGIIRLVMKVKGKQAHSAYPFKGENAIYAVADIISFIKQISKEFEEKVKSRFPASIHYKKLPRRMNVTMVKGGIAENIIPGECEIVIDCRTIPEDDAMEVSEEIKRRTEKFSEEHRINVSVQTKSMLNSWYAADEKNVKKFKKIIESVVNKPLKVSVELGGTDGIFMADRMPVIQFGTIRADTNFHGKNEFVHLKDVDLLKRIIKEVITTPF